MQSLQYKNLYNTLKYNAHYAEVDQHSKYRGCVERASKMLKFFHHDDKELFDCDLGQGFVRVNWKMNGIDSGPIQSSRGGPIQSSQGPVPLMILDNNDIYTELIAIAQYSRSCNIGQSTVCRGIQELNMHMSIPHNFINEHCFTGFHRVLNKIWCENFQQQFINKFNPNISVLLNSGKLSLNSYTNISGMLYDKNYDLGNDSRNSNGDIIEGHEPEIWCDYKQGYNSDDCYDDSDYLLNYMPGFFHRRDGDNEFGEIHVEFRGFEHIYHTNEINPRIIRDFISVKNYFMQFINEISIPLFEQAITVYNRLLLTWKQNNPNIQNEPEIFGGFERINCGMEIETCMDCERFYQRYGDHNEFRHKVADRTPYDNCISNLESRLRYFEATDDSSFDCDLHRGFIRVEWVLNGPVSISVMNDPVFYRELTMLSKYSRSCTHLPDNEEYTNDIVCIYQQATHMHVSLPHTFVDQHCFNGFYRILNRIWYDNFQQDFIRNYNNNVDYWINKNKIAYNYSAQEIQGNIRYPPAYTMGNDVYDSNGNIGENHEPEIWCDYNNLLTENCFEDRYQILNLIPGLSDRLDGSDHGQIHVEFRGFEHIYHTNEINPRIIRDFGSVQNFYEHFFQHCCIPLFSQAIQIYNMRLAIWKQNNPNIINEPNITVTDSDMKVGMEIETCMDCEAFRRDFP